MIARGPSTEFAFVNQHPGHALRRAPARGGVMVGVEFGPLTFASVGSCAFFTDPVGHTPRSSGRI